MMRKTAIYNPHDKPLDDLPVIYGFNNGGSGNLWHGQIIAEDGAVLGGHACSNESWMHNDLGIFEGSRPDRHETFRAHYPDGYRMEFVSYDDVPSHTGIQDAFRRHDELARAAAPLS